MRVGVVPVCDGRSLVDLAAAFVDVRRRPYVAHRSQQQEQHSENGKKALHGVFT